MAIDIKAVNLILTDSLKEYVDRKFSKVKNIGFQSRIEIARLTKHHRKGIIYSVTVNSHLSGRYFRVQKQGEDVRTAIDLALNDLQRKVQQYSAKNRPQDSRGQEQLRKFKEET